MYISYDQFEYTNYFHLAVNDEVIINFCPVERLDDLFKTIIEKRRTIESFELDVIQDENASEWDYLEAFQQHGFKIRSLSNRNSEQLCHVMNQLFDGKYGISGKDDSYDKKLISVLWSGNCVLPSKNCEHSKMLRQEEEILIRSDEEMTELARIIKEKYERLNKHE